MVNLREIPDPGDDEPDFTIAPEVHRDMTASTVTSGLSSRQAATHTHEAHPTVWPQLHDPRWTDATRTTTNSLLKIGDVWVVIDYALWQGWEEHSGSPETYMFNGADWVAVAAGSTTVTSTGDHYTHNQISAASTWTVVHNLGYRPNVTVVDTADTVVIPGMEYQDVNTVVLHFSGLTAGKAYCS